MIAYVHIGTPKTGTTTIQNFLFNQDKIKKYGFYYPKNFISKQQHWPLMTAVKTQKINLKLLLAEIKGSKCEKVIFSSE
ncbi:hypothetical protein D4A63_09900, partial [Campylobacter coli]|nr:hypothetical protein [Campylobacter coli]